MEEVPAAEPLVDEPDDGGIELSEAPPLQPYAFDEGDAQGAAARLDEAFAAATGLTGWAGLLDGIRGPDWKLGDTESPLDIALGRLAAYRLDIHHFGEPPGCRLGPRREDQYAYPMQISAVPDEEVRLWKSISAHVADPGAVARVHDLLVERGEGSRRTHAQQAVDAYLAIENTSLRDETGGVSHSAVSYLLRAWDLTRRFHLWEKLPDVEQRLLATATAELATAVHSPGLVLPLLEALAAAPVRRQPADASAVNRDEVKLLLAQAMDRYPDGRLLQQTMDIARSLAVDEIERAALTRDQAERLLRYARAVAGHLRMVRLQEAIAFARNRGVKDVEAEATVELQRIPRDALGMQSITSSVSIPADYFQRQITPFTDSADWSDGIVHFLKGSCPTGSYQRLVEQEREHASRFSLRRLFTTQHLTLEGRPSWAAQSDDEKTAAEIAWIASISAQHSGRVLAAGLHAFVDRYGVPGEDELVDVLLDLTGANAALIRSLARALRLYLQGEYEASANLIVPKIEAAARMLLLELDEAIYKVQIGSDPGGYGGLYGLIDALGKLCLDEDWTYFLQWLLLGSPGQNARNDLTHGLVLDPGPVQAALILRAAALLITVTESDNAASPRTREDLERLLAAPTDPPAVVGLLEEVLMSLVKAVGTGAGIVVGLARMFRRV